MEPKATCSERKNTHNGLAVYYRAHTDKHTICSHSTRRFLAYISSNCGRELKLNPDKYSYCKLSGAKVQIHTEWETAVSTTEPLHHLINKLCTNTATITLWVSLGARAKTHFQNQILWAVNSLWLCLRSHNPLFCACVADLSHTRCKYQELVN